MQYEKYNSFNSADCLNIYYLFEWLNFHLHGSLKCLALIWNGVELHGIVVEFTTLPAVIGMNLSYELQSSSIKINLLEAFHILASIPTPWSPDCHTIPHGEKKQYPHIKAPFPHPHLPTKWLTRLCPTVMLLR